MVLRAVHALWAVFALLTGVDAVVEGVILVLLPAVRVRALAALRAAL